MCVSDDKLKCLVAAALSTRNDLDNICNLSDVDLGLYLSSVSDTLWRTDWRLTQFLAQSCRLLSYQASVGKSIKTSNNVFNGRCHNCFHNNSTYWWLGWRQNICITLLHFSFAKETKRQLRWHCCKADHVPRQVTKMTPALSMQYHLRPLMATPDSLELSSVTGRIRVILSLKKFDNLNLFY